MWAAVERYFDIQGRGSSVGRELREAMRPATPLDLRRAIGAGIGLFIAFIGTVNARLVVTTGRAFPEPPVTFGSLAQPDTAVAAAGLLVMAVLLTLRVHGAIIL